MAVNLDVLREEIAERNLMLNSLNPDNKKHREKIQWIKRDLDRLLYLYFKSMKCPYGNAMIS